MFSLVKFTGLLLVVASLSFNSVFANEEHLKDSSSGKRKLVIASSNNFPPINLLDESGNLTGFARDLADAVATSVNIEVQHIHSGKWTNVIKWLDEGKADFIHDTGYSLEREAYMDFSLPIIEMPESIFVRERQFDIRDVSTLSGKKVACVNQHITHIYLKQFEKINCYLVNTPAEGLIALINGNVDAFIYPEQIVLYIAQELKLDNNIKIVGEPLRKLSWSMTVKKGNREVLALLNKGITAVRNNGEYDRIYNKWFGKPLFSGFSNSEVFVITIAAVLLSLMVVITFGLLTYNRKMLRVNKMLSESEGKYRTLADKLPQSIFLKDINSVYVSCNQRFADGIGIVPEKISGMTDFDFFPDDADEYRAGDRRILESEKTIEFIESIYIDGKKKSINTIKTPIYDDEGRLSGVLGIFWDITEQLDLQEKHAEIIKEYNAITSAVPDIMYKLDDKGRFTWWNDTFERVTGLSAGQIENHSALEMISEADHAGISVAIQKAFENGYADVEAHLLSKSGEILYYFNGARLLDDAGNLIGLTGSGRDISKQKVVEQQKDLLQRQLEQAQKMESIGQLTGGIAHDFNNILASILGYSELSLNILDSKSPVERLRKYLTEITRSGGRARDLIKQMMAFSRESGNQTCAVNVEGLIDELLSMLRPIIPATVEISTTIDNNLPVVVIDPVMTQQMLLNMCINGRDAMEGNGKLSISVTVESISEQMCNSCHQGFSGKYIQFAVSDTGGGIEPELLDKIFEPFMTTKEVGKGTGMGLSMVHGITHNHHGHILVSSTPGKTTFKILIPISTISDDISNVDDVSNIDGDDKMVIENDIASDHHHILVVDDEVSVAALLEEILTSNGYNVTVKNNGQDAWQEFSNNPDAYDMVITDQTMPNMSGKDMAIQILKIKPEIPILLCTGYSDQINEDGAKEIGIQAFLKKPIRMDNLLKLVSKFMVS